jgi:hypothetical protein
VIPGKRVGDAPSGAGDQGTMGRVYPSGSSVLVFPVVTGSWAVSEAARRLQNVQMSANDALGLAV